MRRYVQAIFVDGGSRRTVVEVDLWGAERHTDGAVTVHVWPFYAGDAVPPRLPVTSLSINPEQIAALRFHCPLRKAA